MSRGKANRAKRRGDLFDAAVAAIHTLTTEELINLRYEISRQMNGQAQIIKDLRLREDAIREELSARKEDYNGVRVTDHAIVRFMERRKGIDIDAIRREMSDMVKASKPDALGRSRNSNGAIFGVRTDEGPNYQVVTTVFHARELPVMAIPAPRGPVAQRIERPVPNREAAGSNPAGTANDQQGKHQ